MDTSQNIQVSVRCRPLNSTDKQSIVDILPDCREIRILDCKSPNLSNEPRSFQFDQVFGPDAKQNDVYTAVVRPLIDQVLQGFNCTVFAYGQTGTGKTYTMEGDRWDDNLSWEEDPHSGIIPRAVSQLFDRLKHHENQFTVRVSFLELYNEDTYDLLSPLEDTTKLKIFEDSQRKGSVKVGGLKEVVVESKDEIYEILQSGSLKRQTAATLLNVCSSRSHTVFSITVYIEGEDMFKTGKLNLVDLAGSENIGRTGAQDKRAREAGNINQSLLTLSRVITALVEKRPHIPYRESKLTRLLQDSLGGKTTTSIIATISPADVDLTTTLSTLEYASRARNIINRPESNQHSRKTLIDSKEMQALEDKYNSMMSDIEFKVRNEVALEFKREMERWKQALKEQYGGEVERLQGLIDIFHDKNKSQVEEMSKLEQDLKVKSDENSKLEQDLQAEKDERSRLEQDSKDKDDKISSLEQDLSVKDDRISILEQDSKTKDDKISELEQDLKVEREEKSKLERDFKIQKELAEYRKDLASETEEKFKDEIEALKEELRANNVKQCEKKASRVRAKDPVLEESTEYANITFDGGDEIAQVSAKKRSRKRIVPGSTRKAIMLSGKKRKIENAEADELSPVLAPANTRVTRSRATKRKLNFR